MAGSGVVVAGQAVTPTTGSAQVVCARSGQLLGFYANATGTVALYDAASATGLPTAKLNATGCVAGWNPFPLEFINGLVANVAAATGATFIFV